MKYIISLIALLSVFHPNKTLAQRQTDDNILGLATPIQLTGELTDVPLDDYFKDVSTIKNAFVGKGVSAFLSADKKKITIKTSNKTTGLANLMIETKDGKRYDFLLKKGQKATPNLKLLPRLFTDKIKGQEISMGSETGVDSAFAYWNNKKIPAFNNKKLKVLALQIPEEAKDFQRSFIRVFAYNTEGVANDIVIPLAQGEVIQNVSNLNKKGNERQADNVKNLTQKIKDGYFKTLNINDLDILVATKSLELSYQKSPNLHRHYAGNLSHLSAAPSEIAPLKTDADMKDFIETMRFDKLHKTENETHIIAEKIAPLRKNRLSMLFGDTDILLANDEILVLLQDYFGEVTISVFNKSNKATGVAFDLPYRYLKKVLKTNFNGKVVQEGNLVRVTLSAASFEVLTD